MASFKITAALPLVVLLPACSPGGGPDGTVLDSGTWDVASFGYQDPYPAGFHPLPADVFPALRKDEVAVLGGGGGWVRDDAETAFDASATIPAQATADMEVSDAVAADVDGDYLPELVVAGRFQDPADGLWKPRVRVVEYDGAGGYAILTTFDVTDAPAAGARVVRVDAGDVDGDSRAEIVLSSARLPLGAWVRVYEDFGEAPPGTLVTAFDYPAADEVRGVLGQLDADPREELAIYHGNGLVTWGLVLDDGTTGFGLLVDGFFGDTDVDSVDLVTGDFDADREDEIAVFRTTSGQTSIWITDGANGGFAAGANTFPGAAGAWSPYDAGDLRRLAAADLDADGVDEVVWLVAPQDGSLVLQRWQPGVAVTSALLRPAPVGFPLGVEADLAVVDDDSDGVDEVVVVFRQTGPAATLETRGVQWAGGGLDVYGSDARPDGAGVAPVAGGGDLDGDGAVLEWTGVKYPALADPMPIVVLSAPPTVAGISQNRDASEVSYGVETATSQSFQVSVGASLSTSVGYEQEDIFGVFSASAMKTLSKELEVSVGSESEVGKSVSFLGSWDDDYVVFQGTLYQVYEYRVVAAADPVAVGSTVTLNDPVDTLVFKWTRSLYQQTFPSGAGAIDWDQVLGHTIGAPATYPSRAALQADIAAFGGWEGQSTTVGQGTASQAVGLSLSDVVTSGSSVSYSVDEEAGVGVGGVSVGVSYGVTNSWLYEVSLSTTTSYDGSIGDIAQPVEWGEWLYRTGIAAYTRAVPGQPAFQVVRFWVDPLGPGYTP